MLPSRQHLTFGLFLALSSATAIASACSGSAESEDQPQGLSSCELAGGCFESESATLAIVECRGAEVEPGGCPATDLVGCCVIHNAGLVGRVCLYPPRDVDAGSMICSALDGSFQPD